MNGIRKTFAVFALFGLTACASRPAEDHYYSLVLAAGDVTIPAGTAEPLTRIVVGPVNLARYLDQPGLAMQVGANRIRAANHHFWAEPLDEAIGKVLVRDISQRTDAVAVDRDAGKWTAAGDCRLRIEFDKFHATDASRVSVTGRYWIREGAASQVTKSEFDIVKSLSADGYAEAVRQLRSSLAGLAGQIVEQMSAGTDCISGEQNL